MSKLTLSVDERVVSRAKRYAKRRGVSVSAMVEAYLASVAEAPDKSSEDSPPILRSVRGILKKADLERTKSTRRQVPMKKVLIDTNVVLDVLLDRSLTPVQALLYGRPSKQVQRRGCWLLTRLRPFTI